MQVFLGLSATSTIALQANPRSCPLKRISGRSDNPAARASHARTKGECVLGGAANSQHAEAQTFTLTISPT